MLGPHLAPSGHPSALANVRFEGENGRQSKAQIKLTSLRGFWSLRKSSAFKRQFDCAGHCNALLSWHGNHASVRFSAIARSELIAAFAGLTHIRIKIGAAIHTVRLRVGRSLGVRLSRGREDQRQPHRKAGN